MMGAMVSVVLKAACSASPATEDPDLGDLWLDVSDLRPRLRVWTGRQWAACDSQPFAGDHRHVVVWHGTPPRERAGWVLRDPGGRVQCVHIDSDVCLDVVDIAARGGLHPVAPGSTWTLAAVGQGGWDAALDETDGRGS